MLQFQKLSLEESRHGKSLTLGDYKIRNGATLLLLKVGFTLNITNPQVTSIQSSTRTTTTLYYLAFLIHKVDVCFLVDCTGSMRKHIEAVKNNVQSLRDHLATEYKGCDLRFSFVRYTDYDQPESTRTTCIDFTRYFNYPIICAYSNLINNKYSSPFSLVWG